MSIVRNIFVKCVLIFGVLGGLLGRPAQAQQTPEEPKKYELGGITVSGARYLDPNTLISLTGLRVGDAIMVPGEEIGKSIRKLWAQGILGDVSVTIARIEGSKIFLDYNLKERPRLSKFTFSGIRKSQTEDLTKKITLIRGKVVTDALLNNTRTQVRKFFVNKGYLDAKVNIVQVADSALSNSVALRIDVDKGSKIRIHDIAFEGNKAFSDRKLKGKLKKTKERKPYKFLTAGKFQKNEYEEDKKKRLGDSGPTRIRYKKLSR